MVAVLDFVCGSCFGCCFFLFFFFSSRRRHTRLQGDWSSDVCSSDLTPKDSMRDASVLRLCVTTFCATLLVSGCSHAPPPDFAPDPGLVAQIRDIRIVTGYARACPGATIPATYEAVLADGSRVPFSRSYDKKHPPRLHVVFLDRESPEAVSQQDGDWVTERDPLATVSTGFRLTATLRANARLTNPVVIPPDSRCMPHTFAFSGEPGGPGEAGDNGPDATVRLAVLRSPFYDKLFVAGIQVGLAPPFYVLQDASAIPPADWLVLESRGGRGGTGVAGTKGTDGSAGAAGCPAQPGAPGGNGGNGGPGGSRGPPGPGVGRGPRADRGILRPAGPAGVGLALRGAAARALAQEGVGVLRKFPEDGLNSAARRDRGGGRGPGRSPRHRIRHERHIPRPAQKVRRDREVHGAVGGHRAEAQPHRAPGHVDSHVRPVTVGDAQRDRESRLGGGSGGRCRSVALVAGASGGRERMDGTPGDREEPHETDRGLRHRVARVASQPVTYCTAQDLAKGSSCPGRTTSSSSGPATTASSPPPTSPAPGGGCWCSSAATWWGARA